MSCSYLLNLRDADAGRQGLIRDELNDAHAARSIMKDAGIMKNTKAKYRVKWEYKRRERRNSK